MKLTLDAKALTANMIEALRKIKPEECSRYIPESIADGIMKGRWQQWCETVDAVALTVTGDILSDDYSDFISDCLKD